MGSAIPEISRLAGDALVVLLHLVTALAHLREGNMNAAITGFSEIVEKAAPGRYVNEAQYWRARLAESQTEKQAKVAAMRDYMALIKRLSGQRDHESRTRAHASRESQESQAVDAQGTYPCGYGRGKARSDPDRVKDGLGL